MNLSQWFVLYLVILFVQQRRYISLLPTIPVYPNNETESQVVKRYTQQRSPYYVQLFLETDRSVSAAFDTLVKEDITTLDRMITSPKILSVVYFFKYTINRARPHQIDESLDRLSSDTADTPAYPSGHAFQAYYLAKVLSERYPEKMSELYEVAEACALSRVYAGLHYPSDNRFSRWLVDHLM